MNFETNISEKLKGYAKIDTFDTFYESFLEKYSATSKLENLKKKKKRKTKIIRIKISIIEIEIQNLQI